MRYIQKTGSLHYLFLLKLRASTRLWAAIELELTILRLLPLKSFSVGLTHVDQRISHMKTHSFTGALTE